MASNRFLSPPTLPTGAVNCWQCRHFASSWDPAMRYSCKALGFKSANLPSLEVRRLDGRDCQGFTPKIPVPRSA